MSRLPFAPQAEQVDIYDVPKGLGAFVPIPEKPVSFAALQGSLKKAGYQLDSAYASVSGTLTKAQNTWKLVAGKSQQTFDLVGSMLGAILGKLVGGDTISLTGRLLTMVDTVTDPRGKRTTLEREVLLFGDAPAPLRTKVGASTPEDRSGRTVHATRLTGALGADPRDHRSMLGRGAPVLAFGMRSTPMTTSRGRSPIRTAGPGLTVYRGGMLVPRLSLTTSRVDDVRVTGSSLGLMTTYTPTPHVQLELDIPLERRVAAQNGISRTSSGIGAVSIGWKYRFFREVWQWGDRQAAVRLAADLPGVSLDDGLDQMAVDPYVGRQIGFASGPAVRAGLNASEANRRVIMGASVEGVLRAARNDFRLGNELRVSTDLEYVLLPLRYRRATGELFLLLETAYTRHGAARWLGSDLPGSGGWEYTVAPGLQYVMSPRTMLDASFQVPVARGGGDHILRVRRHLLLAVRRLW